MRPTRIKGIIMDLSLLIALIIASLVFICFIKPKRDKKAAAMKKQDIVNASNGAISHKSKQEDGHTENQDNNDDVRKMANTIVDYLVEGDLGEEVGKRQTDAPDILITNTVVWMAHCINLPFLSQDKNIKINMEMRSMLNDFRKAVKAGEQNSITAIYNKFQDKMKEKLEGGMDDMTVHLHMVPFKICALSKDLLDLYKMIIEGQKDEDALSGKGSIRRILKYSIEIGSPAKTLDTLTDFFVNNNWFDNMPEEIEWLKLALECMMITGNEDLGKKVLERLQSCGGISDEEKEELLDHAREFRSQIDVSWM